jgi:hypothetical protein
MSVQDAATVQAISAGIIVILTLVLAAIAVGALRAANAQSKSSADAIMEMREDRHLEEVPMLSIRPVVPPRDDRQPLLRRMS